MRGRSLVDQLTRAIKLGCVTLALVTAASPACLYNDYCISVDVPGTQVCVLLPEAAGTNSEGEVVDLVDGLGSVQGCSCLWNDEVSVLQQNNPESAEYMALYFPVESAARQRCLELAIEQGLVANNCLTTTPLDGFLVNEEHCIAGCVYTNFPPSGDRPEVCDPLGASGESGGEDTSSDEETGGEEPPRRPLARAPESSP